MSTTQADTRNPFRRPFPPQQQRDEWEDWEDDDSPMTTIVDEGPLVDLDDQAGPSSKQPDPRISLQRYSVQKPLFRTKSKGRQKAKIAKAGIKLDTDVSRFGHKAQPDRLGARASRDAAGNRFADAAALKALEGSPNSASIGSFSWLKRKSPSTRSKPAKKSHLGPESDLSPDSRPIVIGLTVPEDQMSDHQVSPQTAVIETPVAVQRYNQQSISRSNLAPRTPEQQRSVWSPDTEASESPFTPRAASSVYSQSSVYGGKFGPSDAPPVPALPATYKFQQAHPSAVAEPDDEDDTGTPCTLFEEDGNSPQALRKKSLKKKAPAVSPMSSGTQPSGWWDTVTTPFAQTPSTTPFSQTTSTNPFRQTPQQTGESTASAMPPAPRDWWQDVDEKKQPASGAGLAITTNTPAAMSYQNTLPPENAAASSSRSAPANRPETHSEKAQILLDENQFPSEEPPPYSPPPKALGEVKYGAILPPSLGNDNQRIPSPGPISPGIPGTMSSQGAIGLADIAQTPRSVPVAVLPERPIGTYVTQDQFYEASRTDRTERTRRRHEKEEFVARKAGGFWRGRGCIPAEGCFGRTGREGRKRRRICLAVFGGIIAIIILIVVLAVVLAHKTVSPHDTTTVAGPTSSGNSQGDQQSQQPTVWLNLTEFPPMPTGVLTVTGSNNSEAVDGCVEDKSHLLWSCDIPKDQQVANSPYGHNQPEFIFQIQYDNNSRTLWNITNTGEQPSTKRSQGAFSLLRRMVSRVTSTLRGRAIVYDPGFSPSPDPPEYAEMFFLGNTTDGIVADNKAGEPTPFYISVLSSINATVGPNVLQKRDADAPVRRRGLGNGIDSAPTGNSTSTNLTNILPAPETRSDGKTPAPARLFPQPSQQPLRLYDRGLPTEHYGFYAYYNKTLYVADPAGGQLNDKALDGDGGAALADATALVVWSQARFVVQIWTQKGAGASVLLGDRSASSSATPDTQPGTMPYPVTVTTDLHGGDRNDKGTWTWGLIAEDGDAANNSTAASTNATKVVNLQDPALVSVDTGFDGTLINPLNNSDLSLGGIDGGTGGCRCAWVNFAS